MTVPAGETRVNTCLFECMSQGTLFSLIELYVSVCVTHGRAGELGIHNNLRSSIIYKRRVSMFELYVYAGTVGFPRPSPTSPSGIANHDVKLE